MFNNQAFRQPSADFHMGSLAEYSYASQGYRLADTSHDDGLDAEYSRAQHREGFGALTHRGCSGIEAASYAHAFAGAGAPRLMSSEASYTDAHHSSSVEPNAPEEGLFISASEMQWAVLRELGATSLRRLFQVIATESDYRAQRPVAAPPNAVLKTVLFAWCRSEGRGVHLCIDEAVDAGYVIEGGSFPQEWVVACDEWPPKSKAPVAALAFAPPGDDLRNFPALGASQPPPADACAALRGADAGLSLPPSILPPHVRQGASPFASMWSGAGAPAGAGHALWAPQDSALPPSHTPPSNPWANPPLADAGSLLLPAEALTRASGHVSSGEHEMLLQLLEQGPSALTCAPPSSASSKSLSGGVPAVHAGVTGRATGGWAAIAAKPAPAKPPASASWAAAPDGGGAPSDAPSLDLPPGCRVFTSHSEIVVQLHQTPIVTFHANSRLTLNSGGWRTYSTLKAMNAVLEHVSPPTRIMAEGHLSNGTWHIVRPNESVDFVDGITIPGTVPSGFAARTSHAGTATRSAPPADYVCRLCGIPGHWLDRCPHKAEPKQPPPNYICRLCNKPGHWIQLCPSIVTVPKGQDVEPHHGQTLISRGSAGARSAAGNCQSQLVHAPAAYRASVAAGPSRQDDAHGGGGVAFEALVESLREMSGASRERCRSALKACNGNVNHAAEQLLLQDFSDPMPANARIPTPSAPLPQPLFRQPQTASCGAPTSTWGEPPHSALELGLGELWGSSHGVSASAPAGAPTYADLNMMTPEELSAMFGGLQSDLEFVE